MLSATDLQKAFGKGETTVNAVAGVDLSVTAGEMIAIIGASGSGKTTLIHLLGGLERPDRGAIRIGDFDVTSASDTALARFRLRHIGVVFQSFNL
ncbi:MAG: ATP-binding cassette domain-containing protein, partial [Planctomycetota bacterium]